MQGVGFAGLPDLIYIYIYVYACTCTHTNVDRERESEAGKKKGRCQLVGYRDMML